VHSRTRTLLAWSLWLGTMALCAAGLVATLLVTRPVTVQVLADGAMFAVAFPLGYATVGLVLGCGGQATRSGGCSPSRG
jgi:hypothetical protein